MSDENSKSFADLVPGVKPLRQQRRYVPDPKTIRTQRQAERKIRSAEQHARTDKAKEHAFSLEREFFTPVPPEAQLLFRRPGIQHQRIKRLQRAEFEIEGSLDLHGYTLEQAAAALDQFLTEANQLHCNCVRIVTGKGWTKRHGASPILKTAVNHWLKAYKSITAFCSAPPRHGSTGAFLVLLKTNQDPSQ